MSKIFWIFLLKFSLSDGAPARGKRGAARENKIGKVRRLAGSDQIQDQTEPDKWAAGNGSQAARQAAERHTSISYAIGGTTTGKSQTFSVEYSIQFFFGTFL